MSDNYFTKFPDIYYNFTIGGVEQTKVLKDITHNVRVISNVLNNVLVYDYYNIVDGETPEIISEKFYKTPYYHWLIMIVNQRFDYIADFPLAQYQLEKYITQKYGVGKENLIHHWQTSQGYIVDQTVSGATSVSNRDYEVSTNENKRKIKIINPSLLPQILQQFKNLI